MSDLGPEFATQMWERPQDHLAAMAARGSRLRLGDCGTEDRVRSEAGSRVPKGTTSITVQVVGGAFEIVSKQDRKR